MVLIGDSRWKDHYFRSSNYSTLMRDMKDVEIQKSSMVEQGEGLGRLRHLGTGSQAGDDLVD